MKRFGRFLILFVLAAVISVGSWKAVFGDVGPVTLISSLDAPRISTTELKQGKLKPLILIDVRSPAEFAEDRIAGSQLVPIDDIYSGAGILKIKDIVKASSGSPTVILYCQTGPRSFWAYKELRQTGIKFAVLDGGIKSWRQDISAAQDLEILNDVLAK